MLGLHCGLPGFPLESVGFDLVAGDELQLRCLMFPKRFWDFVLVLVRCLTQMNIRLRQASERCAE